MGLVHVCTDLEVVKWYFEVNCKTDEFKIKVLNILIYKKRKILILLNINTKTQQISV